MSDIPEWKWDYIADRKPDEYVLPEPNQFVWCMADLMFGRRDYDVESTDHWKDYQRPANWRTVVGERYAGRRIGDDIDYITITPEARQQGLGYLAVSQVYDVGKLEEMLLQHPLIIQHVTALAEQRFRGSAMKPLKLELSNIFRTQFRVLFYEEHGHCTETRPAFEGSPMVIPSADARWKQACKQFDLATELICQFLCRHYTIYRDEWIPLMVEHVDLSQYFKHFQSKTLALPRLPMKKNPYGTT